MTRVSSKSQSSSGRSPTSILSTASSGILSSSASTPPAHSSRLSHSVTLYLPDRVGYGVGGSKEEYGILRSVICYGSGEDNVSFDREISKGSEIYHNHRGLNDDHSQGVVPLTFINSPNEGLTLGRREGDHQLVILSYTSGEKFSESVVHMGGEEFQTRKELVEELPGCSPHTAPEGNGEENDPGSSFAASEESASVHSRLLGSTVAAPGLNESNCSRELGETPVQIRSPKCFPTGSSQPLCPGAPTLTPPLHVNPSPSSCDEEGPVHDPGNKRPNPSHRQTEVEGSSHTHEALADSALSPSSSSSSSSRRDSWLGSSCSGAAPPPGAGGISGSAGRSWSKPGAASNKNSSSQTGSSPTSHPGDGCDGYNSADEQNFRSPAYENNVQSSSINLMEEKEHQFEAELRCVKKLEVRRMAEDGNCLFRAVADQVYGDAEMYDETRQMCIDYMEKEKDHFSQFVSESFTAYSKRKRRDKVHGNNLEIQAMAEMYNRPIHIYSYSQEPINIFHGSYESDLPPIQLSYHRGNHYNSLTDPRRPAVGAGLGFGSLRGTNVDGEQVKAALKAQQDQQIDRALLAEGRFYSDMESTEKEIHSMAMEASRAEFFGEGKNWEYGQLPSSEETSTSAAEPSSSGTTAILGKGAILGSGGQVAAAPSSTASGTVLDSANMRMLMSMGFSYAQVTEAWHIFGDDVDNILCFLLERENSNSNDGESRYRKKGKAAER